MIGAQSHVADHRRGQRYQYDQPHDRKAQPRLLRDVLWVFGFPPRENRDNVEDSRRVLEECPAVSGRMSLNPENGG
jgi:hypothetical protein